MATRAILLVALAAFLLNSLVRADDAPSLTGSSLRVEDAVAKADAIFVGQIIAIGFGDTKAKGESAYRGVKVKPLEILHGDVHDPVTVTLHVIGVMDFHEDPPKVGGNYVFFITKGSLGFPDPFTVIKLLTATKANILAVKLAIVSQGT